MAINFGSGFGSPTQPVAPQAAPILNLKKNDILDLTKKAPGLKRVLVGAGWDVAETGQSFDLDLSAFLLNQDGKITAPYEQTIFFNNPSLPGIYSKGDNRTGAGEGDDEQIEVTLAEIPSHISRIVFVVTIAEAQAKRQTFGMVENSFVRLVDVDQNEQEICIFNLRENGSTATAMVFAELYREGNDWRFKAIGEGKMADLNGLLSLYM